MQRFKFTKNFINFKDEKKIIKVPHVGWNECNILNKNKLFENIKDGSDFYFTHSYFLKNYENSNVISKTKYNLDFVSSINYKNIYGVQFHPEKSQLNGLKILKNFLWGLLVVKKRIIITLTF